jgi:transcriptional regulator with XRE-family HTH domain
MSLVMIGFNPNRAEQLRMKKGFRRAFIAGECGITSNYLSLLMHGHRAPSERVLNLMALALGTSTDYLTGKSDDPSPPKGQVA